MEQQQVRHHPLGNSPSILCRHSRTEGAVLKDRTHLVIGKHLFYANTPPHQGVAGHMTFHRSINRVQQASHKGHYGVAVVIVPCQRCAVRHGIIAMSVS
jgi:hypothetical protein